MKIKYVMREAQRECSCHRDVGTGQVTNHMIRIIWNIAGVPLRLAARNTSIIHLWYFRYMCIASMNFDLYKRETYLPWTCGTTTQFFGEKYDTLPILRIWILIRVRIQKSMICKHGSKETLSSVHQVLRALQESINDIFAIHSKCPRPKIIGMLALIRLTTSTRPIPKYPRNLQRTWIDTCHWFTFPPSTKISSHTLSTHFKWINPCRKFSNKKCGKWLELTK